MLAKFIPLPQAAEILGVSPKTLDNWIKGGYFAVTGDGRRKWIAYSDNTFREMCPLQFRGRRRGFLQPDLGRFIKSQSA
ncbi:helix-turn-helix domain-containing protein [uncultured Parasutterella sp.]|uniref:helix-turn-helix domain-containing protein n=1 Tax=uncultured Parasutterella sp. TaxID=1263098 RepID=UPI002599C966|nr:helix-turn-helix domain-containing protein [uncultured Parasutterella sp.]